MWANRLLSEVSRVHFQYHYECATSAEHRAFGIQATVVERLRNCLCASRAVGVRVSAEARCGNERAARASNWAFSECGHSSFCTGRALSLIIHFLGVFDLAALAEIM